MSFTQKGRINIKTDQPLVYVSLGSKCDGCDTRCDLGYKHCSFGCHIYPAIDDKPIDRYVDENGKIQFVGAVIDRRKVYIQTLQTLVLACKIARLCDHYKTR